ncbi:hypothetical protein EV356DRAFT_509477 [Viridothelium virens]|uniref:Uncharacterized protein n=1 Tax=Viridothelium virens TaxID=1048519 RepID=A0A6A6GW93_VIRVR|nr:hypothetical protein EV356DRAFT_509477 [Viridothelium virens]
MAHPSTTTSRRKRQYQPSSQQTLDAFLSRHHPNPPSLFPSASAPEPSNRSDEGFPVQPAHVQSSLLQVGLRVRKSVPEGYKTHKTLGGESALELAPTSSAPAAMETDNETARPRELEPFCGIHRVGGYGVQLSASVSLVPSLGLSSQSSVEGGASMPQTPRSYSAQARNERKRGLDYDDELLDEAFGKGDEDAESDEEEAMGLTFKNVPQDMRHKIPMNRSRSPFGTGLRHRQQVPRMSGGARKGVEGGMLVVDDFPDADFLRPLEDMDVE